MVARARTVVFHGIEVRPADVQLQMASGLPAFTVLGLPDKAVAESRERVRAALTALGLALPPKRITVNLAPTDLPKEGSHYDLPIALGELALDGALTAVAGVLPAAPAASAEGLGLICPAVCGAEAAWAGIEVVAAATLLALVNHFKGTQVLGAPKPELAAAPERFTDLRDIKGQETAKRALLTEAAGRLKLTARGYHRVWRVARTLADLDGGAGVGRRHIAEALSYRRLTLGRAVGQNA